MLLTDRAKRKAPETLVSLTTVGAQWVNADSPAAYLSIESIPRLSGQEALKFARLVRDATVLERTGALVANIDHTGGVIGWHFSRR